MILFSNNMILFPLLPVGKPFSNLRCEYKFMNCVFTFTLNLWESPSQKGIAVGIMLHKIFTFAFDFL